MDLRKNKVHEIIYILYISEGFPCGSVVKNPPTSAGNTRDAGLIPGSGKSPGIFRTQGSNPALLHCRQTLYHLSYQGSPGSITGAGRSTAEGIGYPLQCSWASIVAQSVKNPSAMRETWIRSLGWQNPLEKGKATHSNILARGIPWTI